MNPATAKILPNTQHLLASITGMTCSACATRLEKALSRVSGIQSAAVNFATEQADVSYDGNNLDANAIVDAIAKAGYGVDESVFSFDVGGMTCSACANRIEKALRKLPGILEANVNVALERADVRAITGHIDRQMLETAVEKSGYTTHFATDAQDDAEQHRAQETQALRREFYALTASALLTAPLVIQMGAMTLGQHFHLGPWTELLVATPV